MAAALTAALTAYLIDQATFANPTFDNEVKILEHEWWKQEYYH